MSSEVILRMVKDVRDKRGNLSHYGHFIHDFIVPVMHHINRTNSKYTHIYLENYTRWSSLGSFKRMAEKILGLQITELKTEELNNLSHQRLVISTISFGPYRPIFFKHIIPYVSNTLNITESPYKVILIERGRSKPGAGAHRRFLPNHRKLDDSLSRTYGSIFKNIILESITIDEQVSLFINADIVIGQHGAGLCNIIWMTKKDALVIEFPPYGVDTFKNMCRAKEYKYARTDPVVSMVLEICRRRMPHIIKSNQIIEDNNAITIELI